MAPFKDLNFVQWPTVADYTNLHVAEYIEWFWDPHPVSDKQTWVVGFKFLSTQWYPVWVRSIAHMETGLRLPTLYHFPRLKQLWEVHTPNWHLSTVEFIRTFWTYILLNVHLSSSYLVNRMQSKPNRWSSIPDKNYLWNRYGKSTWKNIELQFTANDIVLILHNSCINGSSNRIQLVRLTPSKNSYHR